MMPWERLCPPGRDEAPRRDRGHQQRDQHVVAGERQAEESPLHLVAADHFHRIEPLQEIAGAAEIADRAGAFGRPCQNFHSTPA